MRGVGTVRFFNVYAADVMEHLYYHTSDAGYLSWLGNLLLLPQAQQLLQQRI